MFTSQNEGVERNVRGEVTEAGGNCVMTSVVCTLREKLLGLPNRGISSGQAMWHAW